VGHLIKGAIMELLAQVIMTVYFTAFIAATLLNIFYTLRGDYGR